MAPRSSYEEFDDEIEEEDAFEEFPPPPLEVPQWALREGKEWRLLDEFDVLVKAEEYTGLTLDLKYEVLPTGVWGIHLVRGERGRIFVNSGLPRFWQRFALFHEIYHLLNHTKGARFWQHTFFSMESFEKHADTFAWAVMMPEWTADEYCDWGHGTE